eukprot:gb/GFBE01036202.1/.p1 GENE.gb/GFBE01036202.1/~~gb/GFBE01036202.1/.p1  ORF type:complete len:272 (+),score=79.81 gb/GFBE01036202.1/:1-816(+)
MNGFVSGNFKISKPNSGNQQGNKFASPALFGDGSEFKKYSGSARSRTTGTAMPRENTVHQGTIVCVKEYGAFVKLGKGDKYKDGFLHIGNLPNPPGVERVEVVETVIREGDKVWVKARDIDDENGKYALDMRYVRQTDGKDLDPFHGRGRLPDTGWTFPKTQLKHIQGQPAPTAAGFGKEFAWRNDGEAPAGGDGESAAKKPRLASDSSSDEAVDDSKEGQKLKKKLEKQKKKLEKMRKKAEKAKQKSEKKKDKKSKKEKKKESSASSDAS